MLFPFRGGVSYLQPMRSIVFSRSLGYSSVTAQIPPTTAPPSGQRRQRPPLRDLYAERRSALGRTAGNRLSPVRFGVS